MKAWEATVRKTQAAARKRANTLFGGMYGSAPSLEDQDNAGASDQESEEHKSGEVYQAERFLPNGDYYTGFWADNYPHGFGKYWWTDGCMYVGDWFRGKTMGRGTFSWPSGATYEGNFKSGFMDGEGTYTDPNDDSYKGSWVMNMKHGHGIKYYASGDVYDGEWCRGVQEGQGKYTWKNGNQYEGEWKNGAISGKGTLCWSNGNMYEGTWENGLPRGNGTFTWSDGSSYVGFWSKNPKEQTGTYNPPPGTDGVTEWNPQELFDVELKECRVCPAESVPILPSEKKLAPWKSTKSADPLLRSRRMSVDGRIDVSLENESSSTCSSTSGIEEQQDGGTTPIRPKIAKRQGEPICKGHKNYDLMLNLQLGIRHSVGRPGAPPSLDLKPSAFDPKEKYWTRFPVEGSKNTPPHASVEFKWKDYCPKVFRTLRMLFKVDPADYMLSICGNNALRELSSPGKSGSFFYLTDDDRYMIKTMKKAEVKVMIRMLSAYYNHFRAYENSMVTKYYGLHCVKLNGPTQRKVRFIIIGNLFCSDYTIHRRYDLKGSTFGRITDKPESEIDSNTTLKDLDLNYIFHLQKTWFQEFIRQTDKDCEFLESEGVMDYSLLVGIHFRELPASLAEHYAPTSSPFRFDESRSESIAPPRDSVSGPRESFSSAPRLLREYESARRSARYDIDQMVLDPEGWSSIQLGLNMPARVEKTERNPKQNEEDGQQQLVGEPTGEFFEVVLFFGIIDILQDYDITKKLEHAYKSIQYDPNSISAVDPKQYSRRFRDYIFSVFAEDG